jgi:hypothetical protein
MDGERLRYLKFFQRLERIVMKKAIKKQLKEKLMELLQN